MTRECHPQQSTGYKMALQVQTETNVRVLAICGKETQDLCLQLAVRCHKTRSVLWLTVLCSLTDNRRRMRSLAWLAETGCIQMRNFSCLNTLSTKVHPKRERFTEMDQACQVILTWTMSSHLTGTGERSKRPDQCCLQLSQFTFNKLPSPPRPNQRLLKLTQDLFDGLKAKRRRAVVTFRSVDYDLHRHLCMITLIPKKIRIRTTTSWSGWSAQWIVIRD